MTTPRTASPRSALGDDRLTSIDALRGFDMFWIIGGDALFQALGKWLHIPLLETQMEHVAWEGFRFYDLIFPLFLFIVGVVLPFSLTKYSADAADRKAAHWKVFRRAALLILLGWFYWGILQFDIPHFRWPGVLQRIGICYFFAALAVIHLRPRGQAILCATLLLGYWAILRFIAAPGFAAGDYSMQGNLGGYLDRLLIPGTFCCYPNGDNEGILSTIPAIGTALLGVLTGHWLRSGRARGTICLGLLGGALGCLIVGYLWWGVFPVIKNLWTSSYVMVAGGWSLLLLAAFYYAIDVAGWKRWAFPFVIIGVNPITIYLMKQFVPFERISQFFFGGLAHLVPDARVVVVASGALIIEWLVLRYLFRNGTFLKV